MSLKAFHLFFIAWSILIAIGFGVWGLGSPAVEKTPSITGMSVMSLVAALGLIVYGVRTIAKFRRLS